MPMFVMLSRLTDEGRKTLQERPERLREVNAEVEAMGARIHAQYAGLGGFEFVNIIEAPSNEAMMRISMELGSRGTVRTDTLAAMNISALVGELQKS